MALWFVLGKLGGGKSMYIQDLIVEELRNTTRNIVTNAELKLPEMAEKLNERYGDTFGMLQRIRLLNDSEICEFWLHPAKHIDIVNRKDFIAVGNRKESRPDYAIREKEPGTLFVIDETPEYFNSRNWQKTGEDCIHYLRVSRKAGDDIYCTAQVLSHVDKQFREFAQGYIVTRNLGYEKLSWFRLPERLFVQIYRDPPSAMSRPMETLVKKIDCKFLGAMYRTGSGAGVNFAKADTERKKKGIPIGWLFVILLVLVAGIGIVPWFLSKKVNGAFKAPTSAALNSTPAPAVSSSVSITIPSPIAVTNSLAVTNPLPDLWLTGWTHEGDRWRVYLSDDSIYDTPDPSIIAIGPRAVVMRLDGVVRVLRFKSSTALAREADQAGISRSTNAVHN